MGEGGIDTRDASRAQLHLTAKLRQQQLHHSKVGLCLMQVNCREASPTFPSTAAALNLSAQVPECCSMLQPPGRKRAAKKELLLSSVEAPERCTCLCAHPIIKGSRER